ncbi:AAA family ATPase [Nocardia neocaledoniensis]|uniref:MinD/ParA family ATP-binding protein n=1 Tax=Nocardia neocaledoniensis TaxID=236511 RepID=UPI003CC7EDF2
MAGSPYSSGVPQQAPGPDSQSPYATRTPAHPGAQYNSIPGDPSPGAGTPADAQTEMFRHDDPRLRAGQNQAPSGDYPLPGQAPQSGYGSGEFAQPTPPQQAGSPELPIQRPDGTWAHPAGGQSPQQAGSPEHPIQRPDGTWAQPAGGQSPQAPELPIQRPDGTWAYADGRPAQPPNSAPQMQQLPDGTWVPVTGAAQWNQQPAQPQYQQPGHGQWGATPQQHGYQPPSLDNVPVKRAKKTPGSGWRKAVHHVSGGAINPGMSAEERRLQELVARIRQPVRGDYRIAVLSLKGGVGKTTTTMGLGSIFSSIRGDRVIAVDANPDFGTLSQRVPLQTRSTVRDLLLDPAIQRYSDVRRHTSQGSSRLEVLASERDPAASEAFNDEEYRAVARILQRFYNIILTDCGTGLMHSAMSGVLDLAHSLVLISSAAIDGARSAAATLDWLSLHGHDHLVRNAVVVINLPREGSPNVGVQQLREYFLSRCRAVHIIPYDEHLSEGAEIDLHRLHKSTKRAYVELAATVADEFGVDHRHFG